MIAKYNDFRIASYSPPVPEHTIMVVGTAMDGPAHVPFYLNDDKDPYKVLGDTPLADGIHAARLAGVENIIAYRLNGTHAEAELINAEGETVAELRVVSANSAGNDISIMAYPTHLHVIDTEDSERDYFFDRYPRVEDLAYAINQNAFFGMSEFTCEVKGGHHADLTSELFIETIDIVFDDGDEDVSLIHERGHEGYLTDEDEVTAAILPELEIALFGEDIEDVEGRRPEGELGAMEFGVLLLCDVAHEDDPVFAEMLGAFSKAKTEEAGLGCVAVIGTLPVELVSEFGAENEEGEIEYEPLEADEVRARLRAHTQRLLSQAADRPEGDYGEYIQVVDGHISYTGVSKTFLPAAYSYAATQAAIPWFNSMTNKGMSGGEEISIQKTKEDIALLADSGYICIIPSVRRGIVPYQSVSYGPNREGLMSKPHNVRISQYISKMLREALDGLVGEAQTELSIDAVTADIGQMMDGLVMQNAIQKYELHPELNDQNRHLSLQVPIWLYSEVESVTLIAESTFPRGVVI